MRTKKVRGANLRYKTIDSEAELAKKKYEQSDESSDEEGEDDDEDDDDDDDDDDDEGREAESPSGEQVDRVFKILGVMNSGADTQRNR